VAHPVEPIHACLAGTCREEAKAWPVSPGEEHFSDARMPRIPWCGGWRTLNHEGRASRGRRHSPQQYRCACSPIHTAHVCLEFASRLSLDFQGAVVSDRHGAVRARLRGEYWDHALSSSARLHHTQMRSVASMDGGGHCAADSAHDGDGRRALMGTGGGARDSTAGEPMGGRAYPYGLADRVAPGVKACEDPQPPANDEAHGAVRSVTTCWGEDPTRISPAAR